MALLSRQVIYLHRPDFILSGNGGNLEIYERDGLSTSQSIPIFREDGSTIFGIVPFPNCPADTNKIIVFGERNVAVCDLKTSSSSNAVTLADWILDVNVLSDAEIITVLSTNGAVDRYRYSIDANDFTVSLIDRVMSQDSGVVVSGILDGASWPELRSIIGTFFGEIIITSPSADGAVLLRINAHTGNIFGIVYDRINRRLFSISDDRSLCVCDSSEATVMDRAYAHTSRPFALMQVDATRVITAGADGNICFWQLVMPANKLTLMHKVMVNCGTIRSLFYDAARLKLYYGTDTGSFCRLEVADDWNDWLKVKAFGDEAAGAIRSFVHLPPHGTIYITDSGCLKSIDRRRLQSKLICSDRGFRNDALLLSFNATIVIAASQTTLYLIMADDDNGIDLMATFVHSVCGIDQQMSNDKICACLWIRNSIDHTNFAVCDASGIMVLYRAVIMERTAAIELDRRLSMDVSGTNNLPSCAISIDHFLIVGLRNGSITVYDTNDSDQLVLRPIITYSRAHGKQGVSDFHLIDQPTDESSPISLLSIGRDGRLSRWHFDRRRDAAQLVLLAASDIGAPETMEWPSRFFIVNNRLLIAGFRGKCFCIYDTIGDYYQCAIDCGGGHRIWQLRFAHKYNDRRANFDFIKAGRIVRATIFRTDISVLSHHLHVSQIFALKLIRSRSHMLMVTGGIDTRLTIALIRNDFESPHVIHRVIDHLSSIHAIDIDREHRLIVSAGGRSEFRFQRYTQEDDSIPRIYSLFSHRDSGADARCLSMKCFHLKSSTICLVAAALSNGYLKCFRLASDQLSIVDTLILTSPSSVLGGCFTKIALLTNTVDDVAYVFAIATNGRLAICRVGHSAILSTELLFDAEIERCGLSAVDATDNGDDERQLIAAIGSESGTITVAVHQLSIDGVVARLLSTVAIGRHDATITAIMVQKNLVDANAIDIYSISLDRRFSLTRYHLDSRKFDQIRDVHLTVADPSDFAIWKPTSLCHNSTSNSLITQRQSSMRPDHLLAIVVGSGMETVII